MTAGLTAVVDHQRVEEKFLVIGHTKQHLVFQVAPFVTLPLLQPVEVTRANQRIVPQNPEEKKQHGQK